MGIETGWLKDYIRDIPDFPRPGVIFKDLTPLLADAAAFARAVDVLVEHLGRCPVDKVIGIEARGFIVAAPVAYRLGAGFVPVRKAGKLPGPAERQEYALEYGTDVLEMHSDALRAGERVAVIDDVLATGGTAAATVALVQAVGAEVVALGFVLELGFLGGRSRLVGHDPTALITYE